MLRPLLAALVTLTAFAALAPNASAVYICGHQNDAQDLRLGDDPVWRTHCTTENLNQVNLDCEATVTVTTTGVTYPAGCDSIVPCNPCCGYCPPPMETTAAAALPCSTLGSPVLDGGFGVTCTAAASRCTVVVATFGSVEDFLDPYAGCQFPIYCFRECGPPMATSSQASPCQVAPALPGDLSATCTVAMCEVGPVVESGRYDHAVSCESFLHCVTEPCPGSGRIEF